MILALLGIVLSYLVGAIPSGYIMGKTKGIDIRQYGSGNIGFTNVLRVMGKGPGIIVLLADIGKALLGVLLISKLGDIQSNSLQPYMPALCGGAVLMGNVWTVFLKFRGGKGVATSLGVFLGIHYISGLIALGVWIITVAITRYVSLGSILLCISFCISVFIFKSEYIWGIRILGLVVTIIVVYRHKGNIQRLLKGEERKFGQRENAKT